MGICSWRIVAALVFLSAATASAQQTNPNSVNPPIVQPGAPGQISKILSPATAGVPLRVPAEADISFMQGMIMHHSQAVEMTDLLRTRSRNKELQALGKRISISQTDEMQYMRQWLEDRGQPVSTGHDHMDHMGAMKGMDMSSMPLMPGMLTPQQM